MNYNKDNGLLNIIRRTDPMIILYWSLYLGCVFLYLFSCFLPCFSTEHESTIGYYCLLGGWSFLLIDFWMFMIWCSNALLFCSLIMTGFNNPRSIWFSLFSFILSISMIFHRYIIYDIVVPIISFHTGYYLWCSSHLFLLLACIVKVYSRGRV